MTKVAKKNRTNETDRVRDLLKKKGCPDYLIHGGLPGLVENWERTVDSVARGYRLGLDDYLNDMDGRQLLEEALAIAPAGAREEVLDRVRRADARMQSLIEPGEKCLWGDEVARENGWTKGKNWWYFTRPIQAGPVLLSEIEKA